MIKSKKLVSCVLICAIMLATFGSTISAKGSTTDSEKLKSISEKYGLKDVEKLPEGVTPIKIKNLEELEDTLNALANPIEIEVTEQSGAQIEPMAQGSATKKWLVNYMYYKNLGVTYEYLYDPIRKVNYYKTCYSVNSWISGFTLGYGYDQTYSYWNINNYNLTLTANAKGVLGWYILVDGGIRLFTTSQSMGYNFTRP